MKQVRQRAKNEHIPREIFLGKRKFIAAVYQWAGTQPNPWALGDTNLNDALRTICYGLFGDVDAGLVDDGSCKKSHTFNVVCSSLWAFHCFYKFQLDCPTSHGVAEWFWLGCHQRRHYIL